LEIGAASLRASDEMQDAQRRHAAMTADAGSERPIVGRDVSGAG